MNGLQDSLIKCSRLVLPYVFKTRHISPSSLRAIERQHLTKLRFLANTRGLPLHFGKGFAAPVQRATMPLTAKTISILAAILVGLLLVVTVPIVVTQNNKKAAAESASRTGATASEEAASAADFTFAPSSVPSDAPSSVPSDAPSMTPSDAPSMTPSDAPSFVPSAVPTMVPIPVSDYPSIVPLGWSTPAPSIVDKTTTTSDFPSLVPAVWDTPLPTVESQAFAPNEATRHRRKVKAIRERIGK